MKELIFLEPVFKEMIWGGSRLKTDYGYETPYVRTGECWGIAAHSNGDCKIACGEHKGRTLSWLWKNRREIFGNLDGSLFPLLMKIIDAEDDLSIQVHPDDAYADFYEKGALGKTECWLVLDCDENASIIIGHHANNQAEVRNYIEKQDWKNFLREIPIKKGDFFQIEPGTIHAIKKGTLILETQQNSDITFRLYDYNRIQNGQLRELHIKESMDCTKVPFTESKNGYTKEDTEFGSHTRYVDCNYYSVDEYIVSERAHIPMNGAFQCVAVLEGEGNVNRHKVKKGSFFIVPHGADEFFVEGKVRLLVAVPNTGAV